MAVSITVAEPQHRLAAGSPSRGAGTDRLESAALLALSLSLSRDFADDHDILGHGVVMYDAFDSWCNAPTGETHGWNPRP